MPAHPRRMKRSGPALLRRSTLRLTAAALVLSVLVSQAPSLPAQAQAATAGSLDLSFGGDGLVTAGLISAGGKANAVAVQSDGKILAVGDGTVGSDSDFVLARYTADGALDTTFGGDGVVTTDFHDHNDVAYAVTVLDGGKILVAGNAFRGAKSNFALARYTADGTLDTSFGTGGKVTTAISSRHDVSRALAVQSDGKVLVAGGAKNDFALARYTPDGVLDTTFGGDGKVTVDFSTRGDFANAVAVLSDGKVLVTGYSHSGTSYDLALARFTDTGVLDTTFGEVVSGQTRSGKVTTAIGSGADYGYAMALQSGGKIVMAGRSWNGSNEDFALARYTSAGDLDASFGTGGKVTTDFGARNDSANALVALPDGKLLVAGQSGHRFVLARYTDTGALDATFGGDADSDNTPDGYVTTAIGAGEDRAGAMALQPGGKIVLAGQSHNGTHEDFALARYSDAGALDTSFGTGGKVTTTVGANHTYGDAVALQPDGKLVVAGNGYNGSRKKQDFTLTRFNPDGTVDAGFGAGGAVTTDFQSGAFDYGAAIVVQPDGKILVAGRSYKGNDGISRNFALARYTDTGVLDSTFGTGGKVTTDFASGEDRPYAMALQSDGKILVGGYGHNGSDNDFALARYTDTGVLDSTFGTGGKVTTALGAGNDRIRAISVLSGGKILVAGGIGGDFALARYTDTGVLDSAFGGDADNDGNRDGYVTTTMSSGDDTALAVALRDDGKIVAAGAAVIGDDYDFAVARYTADGVLDTGFGGDADNDGNRDGYVTTPISSERDLAYEVLLQPGGRIVLAGWSGSPRGGADQPRDFSLVRYTADGSLDASFGAGGKVTTDFDSRDDRAYGAVLQDDGRIVLAGFARIGKLYKTALARYHAPTVPVVSVSVSPEQVDEGDPVTVAVTLSPPQEQDVTIPLTLTLTGGSAESNDYSPLASITIEAGAAGGTGVITTAQDADDDHETFTVSLGTLPQGIEAGSPSSVTVTIWDDEAPAPEGTTVWSATLTVQSSSGGAALGCDNSVSGSECSSPSVLTDDDFTHGGVDHTVGAITSVSGGLGITLDNAIPPGLQSNGLLLVGVRQFKLADAALSNGDMAANWSNTGLSWSVGDTVQITLIDLPVDVTGWNPVLNVGEPGGGGLGCRNGAAGAECRAEGVLTDHDFSYTRIISDHPDGQYTWTFLVRELYRTDGERRNELVLVTSERLPDGFVLTIHDPRTGEDTPRRFPLEQAKRRVVPQGDEARWAYDGLPWTKPHPRNGTPTTMVTLGMERPRAGLHFILVHYDGITDAAPGGVDGFRHFAAANRTSYGYWTRIPGEFISIDPQYGNNPVTTTHARLRVYPDNPGSTIRVGRVTYDRNGIRRVSTLQATGGGALSHAIELDKSQHNTYVDIEVADGDVVRTHLLVIDPPPRTYSLSPDARVAEGRDAVLTLSLSEPAPAGGAEFTVSAAYGTASADDVAPVSSPVTVPEGDTTLEISVSTVDDDEDEGEETFTVTVAPARFGWGVDPQGTATATVTIEDNDAAGGKYAGLIAQMHEWRNDPQWKHHKSHTDRWDRALLAFGETVAGETLTAMTAAEAQAFADTAWGTRWVPVAAALREIESGGPQDPPPQQEQDPPNRAPTVSAAIADATIVNETGSHQVSLSGVFDDADGDSVAVTAASSDEAVAAASVASDYSTLTVTASARGTATVTVTAADSSGATVEDSFTVTVKAAPSVASAISDVSGLQAGAEHSVLLSGTFSDADGDALTITAASSDEAVATVSVAANYSTLTVAAAGEGTATITVTARDSDGNTVSDAFDVSVADAVESDPETSGIAARYDANGDGNIDGSEFRQARQDFVTGEIDYSEFLEVYKAYLASSG